MRTKLTLLYKAEDADDSDLHHNDDNDDDSDEHNNDDKAAAGNCDEDHSCRV